MNNTLFSGRSLAPGIGIGPASLLPEPRFDMKDVKIIPGETEAEIKRFYRALEETRQKTHELKEDVTDTLFEQLGELFSVQELVLKDQSFTSRVENEIKENYLCAESAIINALRELNDEFVERTKGGRLESRTIDFLDVGMRLLDHMGAPVARRQIPNGGVLVARNIAPSIAVSLDKYDIDGLVIDEADRSSHTAVVAQALEIPTVGIFDDEFYENIEAGMQIVVGANQNRVIVNPSSEVIDTYRRAQEQFFQFTSEIRKKTGDLAGADLPIIVRGNLGLLAEVPLLKKQKGAGAGLVRTEFLFMGSSDEFPTENRQLKTYRHLSNSLAPETVTLRTFDVGGDKTTYSEPPEVGGRGVYRTLFDREVIVNQLRAMVRAHQDNKNIRILLPLVGSISEIIKVQKILKELSDENNWELPDFGIMVEVPSIVFQLDKILGLVDFLSIGTNDLLNYLLGSDRFASENADSVDFPDPVLFRYIRDVVEPSRTEAIPVAVCGEIAANPIYTPVLIGLGLSELSLAPMRMPEVKLVASNCDLDKAGEFARDALQLTDRKKLSVWVRNTLGPYVQKILHEYEIPEESRRFDYFEQEEPNSRKG